MKDGAGRKASWAAAAVLLLLAAMLVVAGGFVGWVPLRECPACDAQGRIHLGQISGQPPSESDYLKCIFCEGAARISLARNWTWPLKKDQVEKRIEHLKSSHLE